MFSAALKIFFANGTRLSAVLGRCRRYAMSTGTCQGHDTDRR